MDVVGANEIECLEPLPVVESSNGEEQWLGVYVARKLPGGDDVFRRIHAWKSRGAGEQAGVAGGSAAASGEWWKTAVLPSPSVSGDDSSAEDNKKE